MHVEKEHFTTETNIFLVSVCITMAAEMLDNYLPLGQLKVKAGELTLCVGVCTKLSHEGSPCRWLLILVQFAYIQSGRVIGSVCDSVGRLQTHAQASRGRWSVPGCSTNS